MQPPYMNKPPVNGASISTEGFDDLRDEQAPSEDFTSLQAQLCPTTVKACSPRTTNWFNVSIENLTDMVWGKDAANALVLADPKTKETLVRLIQAHGNGDASSDVIEGKGQVNCFRDACEHYRQN